MHLKYALSNRQALDEQFSDRVWTFATLLAIVLFGSSAWASPHNLPQLSYERTIESPALTTLEKNILRSIQKWARSHKDGFSFDARLTRTAYSHVGNLPLSVEGELDLAKLQEKAQAWGLTDAQLGAIYLSLPPDEKIQPHLQQQLEERVRHVHFNRIGLALKKDTYQTRLLILFSRNVLALDAIAPRMLVGRSQKIQGRVRNLPKTRSQVEPYLTLVVQNPDGTIRRTPAILNKNRFSLDLPGSLQPGKSIVEIMLERGKGPEIAALFPIHMVLSPKHLQKQKKLSAKPLERTPRDLENTLRNLILAERQNLGLDLPSSSHALSAAARSHAKEMVHEGFFAHRSPKRGDLGKRLYKRGIPYKRALENIAISGNLEDALKQWLKSPAHRANILDPQISTFGVAVAKQKNGSSTQYFSVLILADLEDDPDLQTSSAAASNPEQHGG
ncbi:MAG: CAP domain-containing protein [Myxococcota bacterium]|nr:CAP domain-containing protein [Myxococcota bacterium]